MPLDDPVGQSQDASSHDVFEGPLGPASPLAALLSGTSGSSGEHGGSSGSGSSREPLRLSPASPGGARTIDVLMGELQLEEHIDEDTLTPDPRTPGVRPPAIPAAERPPLNPRGPTVEELRPRLVAAPLSPGADALAFLEAAVQEGNFSNATVRGELLSLEDFPQSPETAEILQRALEEMSGVSPADREENVCSPVRAADEHHSPVREGHFVWTGSSSSTSPDDVVAVGHTKVKQHIDEMEAAGRGSSSSSSQEQERTRESQEQERTRDPRITPISERESFGQGEENAASASSDIGIAPPLPDTGDQTADLRRGSAPTPLSAPTLDHSGSGTSVLEAVEDLSGEQFVSPVSQFALSDTGGTPTGDGILVNRDLLRHEIPVIDELGQNLRDVEPTEEPSRSGIRRSSSFDFSEEAVSRTELDASFDFSRVGEELNWTRGPHRRRTPGANSFLAEEWESPLGVGGTRGGTGVGTGGASPSTPVDGEQGLARLQTPGADRSRSLLTDVLRTPTEAELAARCGGGDDDAGATQTAISSPEESRWAWQTDRSLRLTQQLQAALSDVQARAGEPADQARDAETADVQARGVGFHGAVSGPSGEEAAAALDPRCDEPGQQQQPGENVAPRRPNEGDLVGKSPPRPFLEVTRLRRNDSSNFRPSGSPTSLRDGSRVRSNEVGEPLERIRPSGSPTSFDLTPSSSCSVRGFRRHHSTHSLFSEVSSLSAFESSLPATPAASPVVGGAVSSSSPPVAGAVSSRGGAPVGTFESGFSPIRKWAGEVVVGASVGAAAESPGARLRLAARSSSPPTVPSAGEGVLPTRSSPPRSPLSDSEITMLPEQYGGRGSPPPDVGVGAVGRGSWSPPPF